MEPPRPLAHRRLLRAVETALEHREPAEILNLAELPRKLSVLSQEKRFLLFVYLMRTGDQRTSEEIAFGIKDQHSNVRRNLHVLIAERLLTVERDEATGICRFAANRDLLRQLAAFFTPKLKNSTPT